MSNSKIGKSREWQTVADLEDIVNKMETELNSVNINYIKKMLKILGCVITIAPYEEAGIFSVIVKSFRLYLKVYISINPENKKLLKCFERSVPTIITYIIGCLQYKAKKEPNYHYNLLQTLEELLENVQPEILIEISKFDIGTIGCLWNPIDLAGDFNTQSKALNILSLLLKQFDEDRQNEELKCIKWTNLNLFQDKLKIVVQETKSSQVLENSSRELLNNYNMNLSKNLLVYSFHCKSVILDNKYKFYKPLNLKNFWIDVNYCPKTLSFNSRFKLNATAKYININVILKIQKMILDNHVLCIYFEKPGDFSEYSNYFSNVTENVIQFSLRREEVQRLKENYYVIEYFNSLTENLNTKNPKILTKNKNAFDLLKNEMSNHLQENQSQSFCNGGSNLFKKSYNSQINSTPEETFIQEKTLKRLKTNDISDIVCESLKTSESLESDKKKLPLRNLRERKKFFTSLLESSSKEETVIEKNQRKRPKSKKLRPSKSRCKQVCKVIPTLDLTKIENTDSIKQTETHITNIQKKNVSKNMSQPLITLQDCAEVLKQVADIYEAGDTSYAKSCQSYRNFRVQPNPLQEISINKSNSKAKCSKKKINMASESSPEKKRKLKNSYKQENKENINPKNPNVILKSRHLPQTKINTSPHIFKTQHSEDMPPTKTSFINVEATPLENKKKRPLAQTKIITSPHLFETQHSEDMPPIKKSAINVESKLVENIEIDLTIDEMEQFRSQDKISQRENNSSCNSIECETVRGLDENYLKDLEQICTPTKNNLNNSSNTTPISTSLMNISELSGTDMELTQIGNNRNSKQQQQQFENNKTNVFTLKEDNLDMELIQFSNWPNFSKQSEIAFEDTYCDIVKENTEVPIWLQRILNCKSPTKATNCKRSHVQRTPTKDCQLSNTCSLGLAATTTTNCNKISKHAANNNSARPNYFKNCTVFKNRIDVANSSSSEDDCNDDKNIDAPICLQQILNDFESCSDDEFVSNFKTPNKATNCNIISKYDADYNSTKRNYFNDCTIFKNRLDVEDSSSSEDDCNYDKNIEVPICVRKILNDFESCSDDEYVSNFESPNEKTNCIIISNNEADNNQAGLNNNKNCITEDSRSWKEDCNYDKTRFYDFKKSTDQQLQIKQNPNLNLCKKNYIKTTTDKNNRIPKNSTSTIATKCQVTPTAIVMHQIQVSTKKSVIIKNKMPKKTIKASKCLNYYYTNQNQNKSIEFEKESLALQKQNIDGISSLIHRTNPTDNTNHLKETHNKTKVLELYNISENNGILMPFINANPYEASPINPATETVYNNTGTRVEQQQTSLSSPNFWKEFEYSLFETDINTSSPYLQNKKTNNSKSFKKDLLHIFNDYNKTIKQYLDNAQRQCLKNISDTYTHKLLEIAQAIQKKSDEYRMELEQIRYNISRLVRELEWQYDEFIKKTQNFDIHREINKHVFASITSTDISKSITRDYEELFKQLKIEQNKAFKQVLHTYLENHKI